MSDLEYVKSYKDKELRYYIFAYLLISIASIGFHAIAEIQTSVSCSDTSLQVILLRMVMADIFISAICILVVIFNEVWPDSAKIKLLYWKLPSDTVFTRIFAGKMNASGINIDRARIMFAHLQSASPTKQTTEWNIYYRKCREANQKNIDEALRMQLMTRDICLSTISLLIGNVVAIGALSLLHESFQIAFNMLGLPFVYLIVMLMITRIAANNRANRLTSLVIKNSVQDDMCKVPNIVR